MKVLRMTKMILAAGFFAGSMMALSASLTGCLTNDKTTAKSDSTPMLAEQTDTVAAQGNTSYGSAVDLDIPKVLLSAAATAAQSTIDILFVYSGGQLQIMSPVAAKAAGVPLAANYDDTQIKDIQFVPISTKPISSQAADTIFTQTPTKVDNDIVFQDEKFLVKTGKGKLVYLNVTSITGSDAKASAQFTIAISAL